MTRTGYGLQEQVTLNYEFPTTTEAGERVERGGPWAMHSVGIGTRLEESEGACQLLRCTVTSYLPRRSSDTLGDITINTGRWLPGRS